MHLKMDQNKLIDFIINVIDDKAVQCEYLRLTEKETRVVWESLMKTITNLFDPLQIPWPIEEAIQRYLNAEFSRA